MKVLFALALFAPLAAFALSDDPSDVGAPRVHYLSWCVNNAVVAKDEQGATVEQTNCAAAGLRCERAEKILGGEYVSYGICR